jgi:hypothetical protein
MPAVWITDRVRVRLWSDMSVGNAEIAQVMSGVAWKLGPVSTVVLWGA